MPRGAYAIGDETERFACAAGPAGWRYTGQRGAYTTDLTVDTAGRQLRVELRSASSVLRGGLVGSSVVWVRDRSESAAVAAGFLGESPGFLVALGRLGPGRHRVVEVTGPALAARTVDVEWRHVADAQHEGLTVGEYQLYALDTGEGRTVHLAGDVVVAADGVELAELDSPPGA